GGYYGRFASSGHLLYVRQGVLYAAPMDAQKLALTGPAAPVVEQIASDPFVGFAPLDLTQTGTLVYVRRAMRRPTPLLWLNRAGLTQPFGAAATGDFGAPRFSPDGTRLAGNRRGGGNGG